MPERIIDRGLPLAVLPVVGRIDQEGLPCNSPLDHHRQVFHLEHDLVRASPLRRPPSRPNLCHHHFGRRADRQAHLRAMPLADADMLDEAEDLGVPRHSQTDVGHDEDGRHSRVRR